MFLTKSKCHELFKNQIVKGIKYLAFTNNLRRYAFLQTVVLYVIPDSGYLL